jgi:hypothetical protein
MLDTKLSNLSVNTQADALAALCNGGFLHVFDGTRPASADAAISGNTLGVVLSLANPAFGSAASGVLVANAILAGVASAGITATFARLVKSDGVTVVMDISAGPSGANLTIGSFTAGTLVGATSFTHDVRNETAGY